MSGRDNKKGLGFFLAELLILILGISASFALNEYRIAELDKAKEKDMLINFQNNLVVDSMLLSNGVEQLEQQLEFAQKLLKSKKDLYTDSLLIQALSLLNYSPFETNDITYEQMRSTGSSSLIQNDSLMSLIVGLYERGYDIVRRWGDIDGDHVKNRLIPYVEDNFPFELGLNYSLANQSTKRRFVKAVQSDKFSHLVQFGQSYKFSTVNVYKEALSDVRDILTLLEEEIDTQ